VLRVGHFNADLAVCDDLHLVLGVGLELHEVDVERLHVDDLLDLITAGDQAGHALVQRFARLFPAALHDELVTLRETHTRDATGLLTGFEID